MKESTYKGLFGNIPVRFAFHHCETNSYFKSFLKDDTEDANDRITVSQQDIEFWNDSYGLEDSAFYEYSLSVYRVSDYLSKFGMCVIHGAAFLWHEKAYLFCANSGTGKSTQLKNWIEKYGDEITIMNGDKPIIGVDHDNSILVYPSPWKGKEGWGDDSITAPLGGIIYLKQAPVNEIELLNKHKAGCRIISQIFSYFESEKIIHDMTRIAEKVLINTPVWLLKNTGGIESAEITHDVLLQWENRLHGDKTER